MAKELENVLSERVMQLSGTFQQTWDLDSIFPGGSSSLEFAAYFDALTRDVAQFRQSVAETPLPKSSQDLSAWVVLIDRVQGIARRVRQSGAFISCLVAQDMKDEQAKVLSGQVKQMFAAYQSALTLFDKQLLAIDGDLWSELLSAPALQEITNPLEERRRRALERLSPEQEMLVSGLSVDGYHAWGDLYNTVVGRIQIPFAQDGKPVNLSAGQAFNKLSSADPVVRADAGAKWERAWADQAELCAAALNHLAGYRINLYNHRGWDSILKEPLDNNRMTARTLNVMWETIVSYKGRLTKYLSAKAKLLGKDQLGWHDVSAQISRSSKMVSYDEAAHFIMEQFGKFNPEMAEFAHRAFKERWIEAEDRPGKRPGGFCSSFPERRESRIFMTFAGTASNVSTLAHELGHAYHQDVMNEMPQMAQNYAMNVAETASTFAEMIVGDAALKRANTREERLALLDEKLERAVAFCMNIHARFLFETRFYDERRRGILTVNRLNDLMVAAQQEAFCSALDEYHPHFWAAKLHFYATGQPFYNFPYTFGYLFSAGVYAKALTEGADFAPKYDALLRDTGRMMVEDLAARHLSADLTGPDFWASALDLVLGDLDEFLLLAQA